MLASTTQPDAHHAVAILAGLPSELDTLGAILHQAEELLLTYLDKLGVSHPASPPAPGAISTWGGKTAAEHARDEGTSIGRKPDGRKKYPAREIRTVEELEELFDALSTGARQINVTGYHGRFLEFPDGTTIGYRAASRSSTKPTIDITSPERIQLKIHVNDRGWD